MNNLAVGSSNISLDKEGYLKNLSDWSESIAVALALKASIELTDAHWEVIHLLRAFHAEFEHAPAMRIMVKTVKKTLGEHKGNSIYLMQLFPGSPAKLAAKIAGLPRPTNCL